MTVSRIKAGRLSPVCGLAAALLAAGTAVGQEADADQPAAGEDASAQEPAAPSADAQDAAGQDRGPSRRLPQPWGGLSEPIGEQGEQDRRFYLGPLPERRQTEPARPARHAPTSILIGPYLPEGSIALPDLADGDSAAAEGDGEDRASETERAPESAAQALAGEIAVAPLDALDPAEVGAWRAGEGEPFPEDMWARSDRATVTTLLATLPMTTGSPVMRGLARRLLLSPARLPGAAGDAAKTRDTAAVGDTARLDPTALDVVLPGDIAGTAGRSTSPPSTGEGAAELSSPPSGSDGTASQSSASPSDRAASEILRMRLERLAAGGAMDDVLALAERVPDRAKTEAIRRMHSDALLLLGNYTQACSMARAAVRDSGAAYWLRVLALCEALEGNRNATFFRLNLLADGGEEQPQFTTLVEALLSEIEGTKKVLEPDVLLGADRLDTVLFAAARLTQARIPKSLAVTAEPLVLDALIELPDLAPGTHLAVAAAAIEHGLVDGEQLAAIFAAVDFTEAEREALETALAAARSGAPGPDRESRAGSAASAEGAGGESGDAPGAQSDTVDTGERAESPALVRGLRLDALIYQAAMGAETAETRMRWIAEGLKRARETGRLFPAAAAFARPLARLEPGPERAGFADTAGRIHLAAENLEAALSWYETARSAAEAGDAQARRALIALWPLMVVTDQSQSVPYSRRMGELWWQASGDLPAETRLARADRLISLLLELGYEVTGDLRRRTLAAPANSGRVPPAGLWRRLIVAAMDERLGESVLTSLSALGEAGPSAAAPALQATAVSALRRVGLETEARRLALESLMRHGF